MREALYSLIALAWLVVPASAAKTISSKCQAVADRVMHDRFFVPLTASGPEGQIALADGQQDAPQPLIRKNAGLSRQFYRDLQTGDVFAGFNRRIVHGQWQLEVLYVYPDGEECQPFPKQAVKISVVSMPTSVLQFFLRKFSQPEEGTTAELRSRLQHAVTVANQQLASQPGQNEPKVVTSDSQVQDALDSIPPILAKAIKPFQDDCEEDGSVFTISSEGVAKIDIDGDEHDDYLLSGDALYCGNHMVGGGNGATSLWIVTTVNGRPSLNTFSVSSADVYGGNRYAVVVTQQGAFRLKQGKVTKLKAYQDDGRPYFTIRR